MKILAIESSCDETSAAVIENAIVLSNVISSQEFHGKFGGVVPELASRAHLDYISNVVAEALSSSSLKMSDINAIAVTSEPGLIGSLLVGANFGKGLAVRYNLPIVPVNHIEGHLYSGCLQDSTVEFPFITLVVSGGHTTLFFVESYEKYRILGSTVDDAAGEAFDKIATMLGLTYPGGPEIDKLAKSGNPRAYDFPRSMINSNNYNFSFSGLKTSVRYFLAKRFPNGIGEELLSDFCSSVQQAIVDVLVRKSLDAAIEYKVRYLVIAGGVSANTRLREELTNKAKAFNLKVIAPETSYCMDNAAMIAFIAEKKIEEYGIDFYRKLTFTVNSSALRAKSQKRIKN